MLFGGLFSGINDVLFTNDKVFETWNKVGFVFFL